MSTTAVLNLVRDRSVDHWWPAAICLVVCGKALDLSELREKYVNRKMW